MRAGVAGCALTYFSFTGSYPLKGFINYHVNDISVVLTSATPIGNARACLPSI
jgi:hypothetical protein